MPRTTAAVAATLVIATAPSTTGAQTDFYNLDKDWPLRVEDAYATKRCAFELQMAPLTLAQTRDGTIQYRPSVRLLANGGPGIRTPMGLRPA